MGVSIVEEQVRHVDVMGTTERVVVCGGTPGPVAEAGTWARFAGRRGSTR
jgi:hypothetical protein